MFTKTLTTRKHQLPGKIIIAGKRRYRVLGMSADLSNITSRRRFAHDMEEINPKTKNK